MKIDVQGAGPDIVFFHGWGMNAEVWRETAEALSKHYRVTLVDFPGFGKNTDLVCDYDLDVLTDYILPHIPKKAILVGWSMGGLIATNIALKYPDHAEKLVLVSSNAQFSQLDNWPSGMKPEVLEGFVKNLSEDFKITLQRFLMLQARGGDNAKETIRALKKRLYQHGEPAQFALQGGLQLLKNISFVERLNELKLPVLLMFGRLDALVPIAAAQAMNKMLPQSTLYIFDKAAHAPFMSHFDEFMNELTNFLSKQVPK
jgi:pimeloyl-[acyl-carrier protein] methyl ester esterase